MRGFDIGSKISYTDKSGAFRVLTYVQPGYIVGNYFKGYEGPLTSSRFLTEDGHLIQVPDAAWEYLKVSYVRQN